MSKKKEKQNNASVVDISAASSTPVQEVVAQVFSIPVSDIIPNRSQPRTHFDEEALTELSESIRENGLSTPIKTRWVDELGKYEIIYGERRFRAVQMLGQDRINSLVDILTDKQAADEALAENINRKDLHPLEEGKAFKYRIEVLGETHKELAHKFGKSLPYIYQRISMTNLIPEFQDMFFKREMGKMIFLHISKYPEKVQKKAYKEHFADTVHPSNSWKNYSPGAVKEAFEDYHTSLADLPILWDHCQSCPKCTGNDGDLFMSRSDWECRDEDCLEETIVKVFVDKVESLAKENPNLQIENLAMDLQDVIEVLEEKGYTVEETGYADTLRPKPQSPERNEYKTDEEFAKACAKYTHELSEYDKQRSEMEEEVTQGISYKRILIDDEDVYIAYADVPKDNSSEDNSTEATNKIENDDPNDDSNDDSNGDSNGDEDAGGEENEETEPTVEEIQLRLIQQAQSEIDSLNKDNEYIEREYEISLRSALYSKISGKDFKTKTGDLTQAEILLFLLGSLDKISFDTREKLGVSMHYLSESDKAGIIEKLKDNPKLQKQVVRDSIVRILTADRLDSLEYLRQSFAEQHDSKWYKATLKKLQEERENSLRLNELKVENLKNIIKDAQEKISTFNDEQVVYEASSEDSMDEDNQVLSVEDKSVSVSEKAQEENFNPDASREEKSNIEDQTPTGPTDGEPSTDDQIAADPADGEPSTWDQIAADPADGEPSTEDQTPAGPADGEPSTEYQTPAGPADGEPSTEDQIAVDLADREPSTEDQIAAGPADGETSTEDQTPAGPADGEPSTEDQIAVDLADGEPSTEDQIAVDLADGEPSTEDQIAIDLADGEPSIEDTVELPISSPKKKKGKKGKKR